MIIQLNPTIPMTCPKGKGQALFLIDYGSEHNLMWVIAIDDTYEIWTYQNPDVRVQKNVTMGRGNEISCKHNTTICNQSYRSCEDCGIRIP